MRIALRSVAAALCLAALCCALSGCAGAGVKPGEARVTATTFAAYDWAKNLLKGVDGAKPALLTENGVDLHSYNPSAADILNVKNSAVFIYVGGESDEWARDILPGSGGPAAVRLFDLLEGRLLADGDEEGMTASGEEDGEPDEHVWLSVENAVICCRGIEAALCRAFPQDSETIKQNAREYEKALYALKEKYTSLRENARFDTLVIADRYPFRYLARETGLTCFAAFRGCSAESNASAKTISFLAEKLKSLSLPAVVILERSDEKLARTVIETAGVQAGILTLDSMQSVSAQDIRNGASYISICEKNLQTLEKALGGE
ncbi:MAG: zinc ABC transporter substrate-binding protein [Clostridia bacterium]|nr:zinc ABC transporter substrate-binding protein [Clostridia bacterium]